MTRFILISLLILIQGTVTNGPTKIAGPTVIQTGLGGGGGGPSFVRDAFGGAAGACFHVLTCTTTSFTPAVGDYLAVFTATTGNAGTTTSATITDTCNSGGSTDTYTVLNQTSFAGSTVSTLAYAKIGAASSCAVTMTLVGTTSPQTAVIVQQIHGVNSSTPIEGSGGCGSTNLCSVQSQAAPGTGANLISSGSAGTPTVANSYVFTASIDVSNSNTWTAGTSPIVFTAHGNGNDGFVDLSWFDESGPWVSGAVSGTLSATGGAADAYVTAAVVFRP